MSGAECAASSFIGAQAYYVLDPSKHRGSAKDQIIELRVPKIPYIRTPKIQTQLLIKLMELGEAVSNVQLWTKLGIYSPKAQLLYQSWKVGGLIITKRGAEKKSLLHNGRIGENPGKLRIGCKGKWFKKWIKIG
jgi:hypothetical protein